MDLMMPHAWKHLFNSKAELKDPVKPAPCWPEASLPDVPAPPKTCCSIWCTAMWRARIALKMAAHYGKPDVYRGGLSSTIALSKKTKKHFSVDFPAFQRTGRWQIYFPPFPSGALDEDVFLCDTWGGTDSWLAQQSFPGTVSLQWCRATDGQRSQASPDGSNLVFLLIVGMTEPAHKDQYRQHHPHPVDPVKWQMRLHPLISKSHLEIHTWHNHTFTGFSLARLSLTGVSLPTE